ncbi:PaaX family transcriptional regulator C-terminal domain-containing protein [Streptomyces clavuligerus]|uniref:Putative repressor in the phenylacetic acid catabolism n=1 Tax=Streptomyces clavuligerus TaxID=1901 RepID=E2Q090_STRCL|nr:PaaX family transcriptional regulator C-terminal domain-containing protein [Streptomyces clavuligerus]ANW17116.1 repressor [Streptomyces clavuligerus]AXU11656.1 transcriptional regulator [Streptomyces clavuligerus]EFG10433.1 Putative repressor in the phenylacetic acid catabolism [Streptomyces clavuligerus]MBY6301494.1 transcriptional regulator [Streptomyces clavuligerus]QCS04436.1 transcriptional regulator [Streptomyces clavuligerus]
MTGTDSPRCAGPAVQVPTRTLVEALIRSDHTVDSGELYAIAPLLGMTDQQVRLCVKRLVSEGRFTQEGRGRAAVLRATGATEQSLGPDVGFVAHAFRQDAGLAPWDGIWHLVAFAVPESARTARDALRAALTRLGGAAVQGGLYLSANAWEPHVEDHARRLGVLDHLTLLTTDDLRQGEERAPAALARALWPQDEIADRYRRLAAVARPRLRRLQQDADLPAPERLTIAVELAAEFTRAMQPDPLLPPELLPRPWPGAQARELVARCWSLLEERTPENGRVSLFHLYRDAVRPAAADG